MSNLRVAEFPTSQASEIENQVALLERALAEARAGNLETVMVVAMDRRDSMLITWDGCRDLLQFSSHLVRAQYIVQRRMDGTA